MMESGSVFHLFANEDRTACIPFRDVTAKDVSLNNVCPVLARISDDPALLHFHDHFCPLSSIADPRAWRRMTLDSKRRVYLGGELVFVPFRHRNSKCDVFLSAVVYASGNDCVQLEVRVHVDRISEGHIDYINVSREYVYLVNWEQCHRNCRGAVLTWLLCASTTPLVKDVRRLIGQYVWKTKNEAFWEF